MLQRSLRKAENFLAIQLRTEKIGVAAFLHARKVPNLISQDPKHVIMFCPNHAHSRRRLYEAAETNQYQEILSTGKGLRAVTRWILSEAQFSLAKEQIDGVKGGMMRTRKPRRKSAGFFATEFSQRQVARKNTR